MKSVRRVFRNNKETLYGPIIPCVEANGEQNTIVLLDENGQKKKDTLWLRDTIGDGECWFHPVVAGYVIVEDEDDALFSGMFLQGEDRLDCLSRVVEAEFELEATISEHLAWFVEDDTVKNHEISSISFRSLIHDEYKNCVGEMKNGPAYDETVWLLEHLFSLDELHTLALKIISCFIDEDNDSYLGFFDTDDWRYDYAGFSNPFLADGIPDPEFVEAVEQQLQGLYKRFSEKPTYSLVTLQERFVKAKEEIEQIVKNGHYWGGFFEANWLKWVIKRSGD